MIDRDLPYETFYVNSDSLKIYRDYNYQRALLYYNKNILNKEPPWCEDDIINRNVFTNVRREWDRQSKFLIKTVCESKELSIEDKVLNCVLFRGFNLETASKRFKEWPIRFNNFDPVEFAEYEREITSSNKIPFCGSSYLTSPIRRQSYNIDERFKGTNTSMALYILNNKEHIINSWNAKDSVECIKSLKKVKGLGAFLLYQVWMDFTYIPGCKFDERDIVMSGPGCSRGIHWLIFGKDNMFQINNKGNKVVRPKIKFKDVFKEYSEEDFLFWLVKYLPRLMKENNLEWDPKEFLSFNEEGKRFWGPHQVENSMCELQKYMRVHFGWGKVRFKNRIYENRRREENG